MALPTCSGSASTSPILQFQCNQLDVVAGANSKVSFDLSDFFLEITEFFSMTFTIDADSVHKISYGNITSEYDEVKFLAIKVDYSNVAVVEDRFIGWSWVDNDNDGIEDDISTYVWRPLGKLMVLSGTDVMGIKRILLGNTRDVPITVSILVAT